MTRGVKFNHESARRIARVVRQVEGTGGDITAPASRARAIRPDFEWLYEVTAVDGVAETCTVQRRDDAAGTLTQPELTGVYYDTTSAPEVGALGTIHRLGDGHLFFHQGGGGLPRMIIASANMTANDTFYACTYLDSDGSAGDAVQCKRPPAIYVTNGDIGFLGQDIGGENVFIPANMREAPTMELMVEARTTDPVLPDTGRIWLKTT